ncbi:hypothetical protein ACE2AJ_14645 [Aquihabitans daechungensis]|uniref:hypothetical protein n=1 Tax=Aquihabitans daechungensis TaxID=1052257 RepID=UPI003BA0161D
MTGQAGSTAVSLGHDHETCLIHELACRSRALHRHLARVDEPKRAGVVVDALRLGAELLERAERQGDLESLSRAVERLDEEAKAIVASTIEQVDQSIERSVAQMATSLQSEAGPFAAVLNQFDVTSDGNVIDLLRELVSATATKATRHAVKELTEATYDTVERLTRSMATIEKVAAAEQARLAEAQRGTAKGLEHEAATESLLGEFVSVTGDGLDDVSTVVGSAGTKKGDKTITPRGGCRIVTEEKCTGGITEARARSILTEAMANRDAELGMLIVDDGSKVPGNQPFHLIDDDKVVVVAERASLRLVYALFRAKAIEAAQARSCPASAAKVSDSLEAIGHLVEEIKRALDRFRLLRTEHTKASKAIGQASRYVDELAETISESVSDIMGTIDDLVADDEGLAA